MSKSGDVVWADGMAWQRDDNNFRKPEWWYSPISKAERQNTLKNLKEYSDFRWLVKNGQQWGEYIPADQATIYSAGVTDGEALERKAIVKWLRRGGQKLIAAAIERGDHLAGDDE